MATKRIKVDEVIDDGDLFELRDGEVVDLNQANGRHTLKSCPGYSPDLIGLGDCYHCGHTARAHEAGQ